LRLPVHSLLIGRTRYRRLYPNSQNNRSQYYAFRLHPRSERMRLGAACSVGKGRGHTSASPLLAVVAIARTHDCDRSNPPAYKTAGSNVGSWTFVDIAVSNSPRK
jgi:hypothetical protein